MYCNDCKSYFDEPIVEMDRETGYREATCPHCGSDYLEETQLCKCCGADTVNEYCDNCMEEIAEELRDLQKRFDITEEVLEEMIVAHYGF